MAKVDAARFDAELAKALKGTRIAKRKPSEKPAQVIGRLTKETARKLISALAGS